MALIGDMRYLTIGNSTYEIATSDTYSNQPAAENGTTLSLVTTGDKYTWNNKADGNSTGAAVRTAAIPFGKVNSTSTSTAYTATVNGITTLADGVCMFLMNGVVTSASGFTININNLGAKPVYNTMAAATAITTTFNVNYTMLFVYNSQRITNGCWDMYYGYNSDTTTARGQVQYYFRPYAGQTIYRYKFVMQGADNRVYPIVTTNQQNSTQVTKTPTTVGLRPWKIWYYNGTDTISAGSATKAQTLLSSIYATTAVYNFNASTGTYKMIYLQGSYDKDTDLFTLDTGSNYYKFVPTNTANITLSTYLTSGKYYLLLGGTYSSTNYFSLFEYNPFYYFDGTNLIPVYTKIAKDLIPTNVSSFTNDAGYLTSYTETDPIFSASAAAGITSSDITNWNGKTSNTGTVTQISAGTGLTGGPVTTTGTIKANLNSQTSLGTIGTTSKLYAVGVDSAGKLAVNVPWENTTYTFDGTYNSSSNKAATVSTVTNAINALDGTLTGSPAAGKTLTAFSQTDGKVTATFGDISITKSQISDLDSVLTYKGVKATVSALPSSGNTTGDVWHVTTDSSEYAWNGTTWQELGTTVDLSGYVPTSRTINGKALSSDISLTASDVSALSNSTTYVSSFNGSTGAITYTAPVTSVNGQTGAVTIAEDNEKWNGVQLAKQEVTSSGDSTYVPLFMSLSPVTVSLTPVKKTPTANVIAKYDASSYLYSTTPTASDNSTKVATTAYVDAAIPTMPTDISAFTNDAGYITSADVPEGASAYTGTISAVGTTASNGSSNGFARGDHVHNITSSTITSALGYTPYNSTNPNGYTTNTGTVTQVTVGSDLKVGTTAGGNFTTSGTITHANSVTAQTTQAIYPIKIDANGHISAYGTAVTIPDVSGKIDTAGTGLSKSGTTLNHSNSVTAQTTQAVYPIKIDAQGHISAYGDAVTISDTKVTQTNLNKTNSIKGILFSSGSGSTVTDSVYTSSRFRYNDYGPSVYLYNSDETKYSSWQYDLIRFGNSSNSYTTSLSSGNPSGNINLTLPTITGTLALTSNIPTVTLNGSATTSPSFYAPTSAGTSGYYLKSNGSGAPTWTSFPNIPSAGTTASAIGTTSSGGSASTYSKSDHVHNITDTTIITALGYTPGQGQTTAQIIRW